MLVVAPERLRADWRSEAAMSSDSTQRAPRWTLHVAQRELQVPDVGRVDTWTELLDVREPLVSFRHWFRFDYNDVETISDSTLRFRDGDGIIESLERTGFDVREVRDAPDRPGLEFVFIAQRR
jgi:hypothetical protein